jgi:hypothetical protein
MGLTLASFSSGSLTREEAKAAAPVFESWASSSQATRDAFKAMNLDMLKVLQKWEKWESGEWDSMTGDDRRCAHRTNQGTNACLLA